MRGHYETPRDRVGGLRPEVLAHNLDQEVDPGSTSCRGEDVPMAAMRNEPLRIHEDDLSYNGTRALLALHLAGMHATSPPGSVFALDLSGLQDVSVTVWTLRDGDDVVGVGALKMLADGVGELKSMRTHPDHLRQGVAGRLLDYMIEEARRRGLRRLSLETGSGPAFDPAFALYRERGFVSGETFADYERSEFNQFLHLAL